MPFREKSAWIMSFLLAALGSAYFYMVATTTWSTSGQLAAPMLPLLIVYAVCLTAIAIVGHIAIAILAPKDATAAVDERERRIFERAGHYSSYFLAAGVLLSLGSYLFVGNGDLLFYAVFASVMLGQIMEYVFQIVFYRSAV
jgi:hypothetical protein